MAGPLEQLEPHRVQRFTARSALGLLGVLGAGTVFALLLLAALAEWAPLRALDTGAVAGLNDLVSGVPLLVSALQVLSNLGGSPTNWLIITVLVVWLLIRRLPRLAVYVAVTGVGAAILDPGVKELVGRARPVVDVVVATAPGRSFPSGHALGSTVAYGLLLLVFLPAVPRRARGPVVAAVVGLLALVGFTRVALGVHYVSDVFAGWALGAAWLGVTAAAFRWWRREDGLRPAPVRRGLVPEAAAGLAPAPAARRDPLPHPVRAAAGLAVAWVLLFGVLVGAGLAVTELVPDSVLDRVGGQILAWFVALRDPALTPLMDVASHLGSTAVIVAVFAAAAALALAVTRRWRAPVFLAAVMLGESTLFLAVAYLIGRSRPAVPHLGPQLPPTSSFPSGHVSAALALYGAIALLAPAWSRGRWRWLGWVAVGWAVLAPLLVAAARLYRGVHFPADVLGSVLLSVPWLAVCWRLLRPAPPSDVQHTHGHGRDRNQVSRWPAPEQPPRRRSSGSAA